MSDLRFEDLTKEQTNFLVDDCGKPGYLDVPDFVFKIACERHDFDYWQGCTKDDRYAADVRMYDIMRGAIRSEPWYRKMYLYPIARMYYFAVRVGSSEFFYYGDEKRTLEDLLKEMAIS